MPNLLKVGAKHINVDMVIKVGVPYKTRKDEDCVNVVIAGSEDVTLVGSEAVAFLAWLDANAVNTALPDDPKFAPSPIGPLVQTKAPAPSKR